MARNSMLFEIKNGKGVKIEEVSKGSGINVYKLSVKIADIKANIEISVRKEMKDIYNGWHPLCYGDTSLKQWFRPNKSISRFCYGAPLFCLVSNEGNNAFTIALSDTVNDSEIAFSVDDLSEKDEINFAITICPSVKAIDEEYSVYVRTDERNISFSDAVSSVSAWWRNFSPKVTRYSEQTEMPLYSTWYNFHQHPRQDRLVEELKIASEIGFSTVIIDDGWQFSGNGSGDYVYCGDWEVATDKFYDFQKFTSDVHNFGMKVMLWFPVPFVGYKARAYKRFENKLLYLDEVSRAGVLDIRYKDVRDYIVNTYVAFVERYDLDGLKLDFIDTFKETVQTPPANCEMDSITVSEAAIKLLEEINSALFSLKKDFMIEFRQNYIGAKITSFCNMLRVGDCAFDAVTNRIGVVDLRLLNYDLAVHSDMLLWAKSEKAENCARQLLNIMFSVPQISVLLTEIPEQQKKVIANYLSYYKKNKDVLLHGKFRAYHAEAKYSTVSSETEQKKITVLHSDGLYEYCGKSEDVFNNTQRTDIVVKNGAGESLLFKIYNCFGEQTESFICNESVVLLKVLFGGRVSIVKQGD